MPRVVRVVAASHHHGAPPPRGSVIVKPDERRVQRGTVVSAGGAPYTFELAEAVTLRMGDLLVLDDGGTVEVVVEAEPLIEVRGRDLAHLAKLAWHLGDRHVPVQILPNRLRLRPDGALEALLAGLGARVAAIEAPFDPEGGAYAAAGGGHHHHHGEHDHDHGHDHDHAHGHHHHHHRH